VLSTILVMLVIIAVGTRASDNVEVRQQEVILANLPEKEALAYYDILRRRLRRVMILRAVAVLALVTLVYAYKHRLARAQDGPAAPGRLSLLLRAP
jgi:hypothetical protein